MNKIIDYFNNNAFVASIITLVLSALITIIINIIDKNIDRKNKEKDIKKDEFHNRGELRINKSRGIKFNDQINILYSRYECKGEKCIINKNILNPNSLDYIYIPITNIGKTAIREMYITVNNRNITFIIEKEKIKYLIKGQYVNYVVPYFDKLLPNESVLIDLSFMKNDKVFVDFSAELTVYYMDDYGNCYHQPLFLRSKTLEGPYKIEYKDYRKNTSMVI